MLFAEPLEPENLVQVVRGKKSFFHRVVSDEVWRFRAGASLWLWWVPAGFGPVENFVLGPPGRGRTPVAVIRAGEWQAAESTGAFTLVGRAVDPGFDFADFTSLRDHAQ